MGNVARPARLDVFAALVSVIFISLFASRILWSEKTRPETHGKTGTVVVVYDGDTVKVRFDKGQERKVRLIGIDCPEIEEPQEGKLLQAQLAKRFAFHHLFRKTVELTYESECEDKYGRLLAYIWIEGRLFNEFILSEGFARVFLAFPFKMKERFVQAQKAAQEQGRGLWRETPYPLLEAQDVKRNIGKLVRVRFDCVRIRRLGRYHFLYAGKKDIAVLIPEENRADFSDVKTYKGRKIEAFGFLEEYEGQPQIMVFIPSQLKLIS